MLLLNLALILLALTILHGMNQPWELKREDGRIFVKLELYGYQCHISLSKWKVTLKTHNLRTKRKNQ